MGDPYGGGCARVQSRRCGVGRAMGGGERATLESCRDSLPRAVDLHPHSEWRLLVKRALRHLGLCGEPAPAGPYLGQLSAPSASAEFIRTRLALFAWGDSPATVVARAWRRERTRGRRPTSTTPASVEKAV